MSTILQVKRLRVPKDQRCDVTELLVEGDRTGAAELSGFCYRCWVLEEEVAAPSILTCLFSGLMVSSAVLTGPKPCSGVSMRAPVPECVLSVWVSACP